MIFHFNQQLGCWKVFMVTSDHSENVVKLSKCSYYKRLGNMMSVLACEQEMGFHLRSIRQADYSTHLLTYTFMNVGASSAFAASG